MSGDEKMRTSGEVVRAQEPVLPTVNPEVEKAQPAKASIHPAAYVAYVHPLLPSGDRFANHELTMNWLQNMDQSFFFRYSVQQVDSGHPELQ
jgi:hypothetical protein